MLCYAITLRYTVTADFQINCKSLPNIFLLIEIKTTYKLFLFKIDERYLFDD